MKNRLKRGVDCTLGVPRLLQLITRSPMTARFASQSSLVGFSDDFFRRFDLADGFATRWEIMMSRKYGAVKPVGHPIWLSFWESQDPSSVTLCVTASPQGEALGIYRWLCFAMGNYDEQKVRRGQDSGLGPPHWIFFG